MLGSIKLSNMGAIIDSIEVSTDGVSAEYAKIVSSYFPQGRFIEIKSNIMKFCTYSFNLSNYIQNTRYVYAVMCNGTEYYIDLASPRKYYRKENYLQYLLACNEDIKSICFTANECDDPIVHDANKKKLTLKSEKLNCFI